MTLTPYSYLQWVMVGISIIIFIFLPESPWWLASNDNADKAAKVLKTIHGNTEGYDIPEQIVRLSLSRSSY